MAEAPPVCRECGGPKPRGRGRKLCDGCRAVAAERERERGRDLSRRHYQRNREEIIARSKRYAEQNAEKVAAYKRERHAAEQASGAAHARTLVRYGLTPDDYQRLLDSQAGGCAICGGMDERRRLNVDHDHATGEVRGLLCSGCNGARLGRLGDSPERADELAAYYEQRAYCLRAAAEYLRNPPARTVLGSDRS